MLFLYVGSFLAILITLLLSFYVFNIVSNNPSFFEPFFSPWPHLFIFFILNSIQLTIFVGLTKIINSSLKLNLLPDLSIRYFLFGFIFSLIYILLQIIYIRKVSMLNNYHFLFIIYPAIIFIILLLVFKFFKK